MALAGLMHMGLLVVGVLFLAIAYASWHNSSHFAYMMAWFLGAGNLAYMIGNGVSEEVLYIWAMIAGLAIVGVLRDRLKSS
jgi:nucleoside recognition membrane protein YjiH